MGRRKLPIEFIKNDKSRRETFKKRMKGLKGKAEQLATLCNAEIGLIIICDGKIEDAGYSGTPGGNPINFKNMIEKYVKYFYYQHCSMMAQRLLCPETQHQQQQQQQQPFPSLPGVGNQLLDLNNVPKGFYPKMDHHALGFGVPAGMESLAGYNQFGMPMFPFALHQDLPLEQKSAAGGGGGDARGSDESVTESTKSTLSQQHSAPVDDHCGSGSTSQEIDQLCSTEFNFDNNYVNSMIATAAAAAAAATNNGDSSRMNVFFDPFEVDFERHWADDPAASAAAATSTAAAASTTANLSE